MRGGGLVVLLTIALAIAAAAAAFGLNTPRPDFMASCVAVARYGDHQDAVDACKTELFGLRPGRSVVAIGSGLLVLILVPTVIANGIVLSAWLPILLRRS